MKRDRDLEIPPTTDTPTQGRCRNPSSELRARRVEPSEAPETSTAGVNALAEGENHGDPFTTPRPLQVGHGTRFFSFTIRDTNRGALILYPHL